MQNLWIQRAKESGICVYGEDEVNKGKTYLVMRMYSGFRGSNEMR